MDLFSCLINLMVIFALYCLVKINEKKGEVINKELFYLIIFYFVAFFIKNSIDLILCIVEKKIFKNNNKNTATI